MGQPMEPVLRQSLIALRLAEYLGLTGPDSALSVTHTCSRGWVAMLLPMSRRNGLATILPAHTRLICGSPTWRRAARRFKFLIRASCGPAGREATGPVLRFRVRAGGLFAASADVAVKIVRQLDDYCRRRTSRSATHARS